MEPSKLYAPQSDVAIVERRGAVAILTLNRPAQRNSLSLELIGALRGAMDRLGAASDVSAVVLTGAPPAFCAGHD